MYPSEFGWLGLLLGSYRGFESWVSPGALPRPPLAASLRTSLLDHASQCQEFQHNSRAARLDVHFARDFNIYRYSAPETCFTAKHDGTHDLDTRAHAWSVLKFEPAAR